MGGGRAGGGVEKRAPGYISGKSECSGFWGNFIDVGNAWERGRSRLRWCYPPWADHVYLCEKCGSTWERVREREIRAENSFHRLQGALKNEKGGRCPSQSYSLMYLLLGWRSQLWDWWILKWEFLLIFNIRLSQLSFVQSFQICMHVISELCCPLLGRLVWTQLSAKAV